MYFFFFKIVVWVRGEERKRGRERGERRGSVLGFILLFIRDVNNILFVSIIRS